jgi:ABC-type branched-subunit amino acid transport system substrate-binding protein
MKRIPYILFFLCCITQISAQGIKGNVKIGLLTSLYLDSAFDQKGNYRLQKNFPKQAVSGLEFYEGASLAIDSLNKIGYLSTMKVFDLQSNEGNIEKLAATGELSDYNLLIAHTGSAEYLQLAAIAKEKNIPLINANYPNDGGIRKSPTVYLANPKINSHLNLIHNQLTRKWPDANIIWFKRNEPGDDRLANIFKELSTSSNKIKYKTVELSALFSTDEISIHLDTNKTNVLIAGSLDETFSAQFAKAILNYTKKGIIHVIGMPNWETLKDIQSKSYAGVPIYYTSGFFAPQGNKWVQEVDEKFKENTGTKASISAIRGYELTFFFGSLWSKYKTLDMVKAQDPSLRIVTDYDFRAVTWNTGAEIPDYYENKRLYFIRRLNGIASLQ